MDAVNQGMDSPLRRRLGSSPQSALELSHFEVEPTPDWVVGPDLCPDMPSRLPPLPTRPPQGPFPLPALCCTGLIGTTIPSDSRCAVADFTLGLYDAPCPDEGNADGSLLFRNEPSTRATARTPGRSAERSGSGSTGVAFAAT